jgi:hypothetical protein
MKDEIDTEKKEGEIPDEEENGDNDDKQEVDVGTGADSDE